MSTIPSIDPRETQPLDAVLAHLRALVAFDTRNPPRAITRGIFDYLEARLRGFRCTFTDHGDGALSLLATRGRPRVLFNVHLDTVPDSPHWSASPFELRVDEGRAIGLGACDTKGAAAALLAAAEATDGEAAMLFTSDEEANDARCVGAFIAQLPFADWPLQAVVVAEPTRCEAVLVHRGISSVRLRFRGSAGHASGDLAANASALHHAVRWGARALELATSQEHERFGGLTGLRFNIGRIEGGIKANMVAPEADLRFGFRPLPSMSFDRLHERFATLVDAGALERYEETFRGPPLPAGETADAEQRRLEARDLADALGLPIGNAVDFWTEASLFSAAGLAAIVFGPGDIAQAHAADEWVALDQLAAAAATYQRLFEGPR
ncbi:MAG: acetylornithine deacetylase [Lysobacteraceae bacterium]|nr:MAG: acetylornithine deacetylase [Xanthomonadaceae bacterium]